MKKILLAGLMFLNCISISFSQEFCENFKIVSILDFPPSPKTPGGNYFLLLLTVEEDNLSNSTIYTDLYFVDEQGDTISVPTGPSSHLPVYSTDTLPYILKLNTTLRSQDFPVDFNGKLIIKHPSHPICEVNYSNVPTNINSYNDNKEVSIYPNPFVNNVNIKSNGNIDKITVHNSMGIIIKSYFPNSNSYNINLEGLRSGEYFVIIYYVNRQIGIQKIQKMQ